MNHSVATIIGKNISIRNWYTFFERSCICRNFAFIRGIAAKGRNEIGMLKNPPITFAFIYLSGPWRAPQLLRGTYFLFKFQAVYFIPGGRNIFQETISFSMYMYPRYPPYFSQFLFYFALRLPNTTRIAYHGISLCCFASIHVHTRHTRVFLYEIPQRTRHGSARVQFLAKKLKNKGNLVQ